MCQNTQHKDEGVSTPSEVQEKKGKQCNFDPLGDTEKENWDSYAFWG